LLQNISGFFFKHNALFAKKTPENSPVVNTLWGIEKKSEPLWS